MTVREAAEKATQRVCERVFGRDTSIHVSTVAFAIEPFIQQAVDEAVAERESLLMQAQRTAFRLAIDDPQRADLIVGSNADIYREVASLRTELATLHDLLSRHWEEAFPNYDWTDWRTCIDLAFAEVTTCRTERDILGAELAAMRERFTVMEETLKAASALAVDTQRWRERAEAYPVSLSKVRGEIVRIHRYVDLGDRISALNCIGLALTAIDVAVARREGKA